MTGRFVRISMVVALVAFGFLASRSAAADIASGSSDNVQEGDNTAETSQDGEAQSGDAVAGQVVGAVSGGDTSIDATNSSVGASASSDYASGANSSSVFTGLTAGTGTVVVADVVSGDAINVQEGDNDASVTQSASAVSGDGIAGQVIGAVTSAGGSADIVAANTSDGADGAGGSADASNDAAAFAGLNATGTVLTGADIAAASATNVQEGGNEVAVDQGATAPAGDGVAGQVLGVVAAGDASIDATNGSAGASAGGGSSEAFNLGAAFAGLTAGTATAVASDVVTGNAANVQEGDDAAGIAQAADAPAGDAVAGQVAGVVTSAGGSADLVLSNASDGASADAGTASIVNFSSVFTGLVADGTIAVF